jgi:hypothetical protein
MACFQQGQDFLLLLLLWFRGGDRGKASFRGLFRDPHRQVLVHIVVLSFIQLGVPSFHLEGSARKSSRKMEFISAAMTPGFAGR